MTINVLKYCAFLAVLSAPAPAFATYTAPGLADIAAELAYRQMADNYSPDLRQCEPGAHSGTDVQRFRCVADR
jgi:hypothetical protein